jgi:predicted phage terminase large subunit-like protein
MAKRGAVVTTEQAAAEKVRREQARRGMMAFTQYVAPWYRAAGHHVMLAGLLEEVLRYIETRGAEGIGRLMVFEPPRHGKTEQVSRLFPSFLLGQMPDSRVIVTSYGADLAQDDSKAIRDYVTSERYGALFGELGTRENPVALSQDTRSKANWDLAAPHRGGVVAAGVGGGITGKGAHLLVIDDPFKNRDEAESEAYRRRVMAWYQSSAYTRLEDGGAVVITHTRWHPDDLAGQLLRAMVEDPLADQWTILFLPARALAEEDYPRDAAEQAEMLGRGFWMPVGGDPLGREEGEALWPEKYTDVTLERIRANVGNYDWSALYQQLPRPHEGGFFEEGDFALADAVPEGLFWMRYVDLALGRTQASDWNTCAAVALDQYGVVWIRDMIRVHELTAFLDQLESWMVSDRELGVLWGVEDVAFQSLVWMDLMKRPRLAGTAITRVKPEGDKVARARALQTRAQQGLVRVVRGKWLRAFFDELADFPTGRHDDQVDTVSGGLQMVSRMSRVRKKAKSWQG